MTRNEAVQKLSKVARISVAYAEDLYDSFFEKPVVPQYVADWYEENKDEFEVNLFQAVYEASDGYTVDSTNEFWHWLMSKDINALTILVNMHQFGYEVKEETKYRVKMKSASYNGCSQFLCRDTQEIFWASGMGYRRTHTRKELEEAGFGWVFDCPGVEVKEVK